MGTILTFTGEKIIMDDDIFELVKGYRFNINHGYPKFYKDGKVVQLHQFVLDFPFPLEVDHISGDKLDARRSNLRAVTHAQNQANRKVNHTSKSGYKGVIYDTSMSRKKRWAAHMHHDGKRIKIGRYMTAEEAARAYDNLAIKLKGEYARLNFGRIAS